MPTTAIQQQERIVALKDCIAECEHFIEVVLEINEILEEDTLVDVEVREMQEELEKLLTKAVKGARESEQ